ncbi:hypothetical protein [Brachyspira murdochii]|uniref:SbsA Ig-like domain-containing protein n=1 Tax=Brachyspira murdochii TaxID=84378 RepID=A0ABX5B6S9_9SPIR|nr:hypothetical protein [Brachyspira murdochii]PPS21872.1 hypothetical protein DJ52_08295 [Brachyspira murdochii]
MKKILIFIIPVIFLLSSCNEELITIVDEYNSPYDIKAIASNNAVYIDFWSGIIASDFAGFNIYASTSDTFTQPDSAIKNASQTYPTISGSNHTRTNFVIQIPTMTFNNGTLYYVTVTAYGTNNLVDKKYIETPISTVCPVIPRPENAGTGTSLQANGITVGTMDPTGGKVTVNTGWGVQYFGYQTNFNSIVIITNNTDASFDTEAVYSLNGLYVFKQTGGNGLAKIWITSANGYRWAYQADASKWRGI